MESKDLIEVMKQVEEKGIGWDVVAEKVKVSHAVLDLYTRSGPVPVTVINNMKKLLEEEGK
jgi:predicted site-specific integrase-resolvase